MVSRRSLKVFVLALGLMYAMTLGAQPKSVAVSGRVVDSQSGEPLEGVVVNIDELWAVSDSEGAFAISRVQTGTYNLKASLLGYVDYKLTLKIERDIDKLTLKMSENSLALKEVVVTAQRPKDGTGTTHDIGRDALNHLQLSSMTDMAALLPGGRTSNPDLTSASSFSVRSAGSAAGNAAFSTAVEVDGVRLGGNADFGAMSGIDTRSCG